MARRLRVGPGGGDFAFDVSRFLGGGGAGGRKTSGVRKKFLKQFQDTFSRRKVEASQSKAKKVQKKKLKSIAKEVPEKTTRTEFDEAARKARIGIGIRRRARRRAPVVSEKFRQSRRMEEKVPSEKSARRFATAEENRILNSRNQRRAQALIEKSMKKLKQLRSKKRGK